MTNTITLYRHIHAKVPIQCSLKDSYSLEPYYSSDEYERVGHDDGGKRYLLPAGFSLGKTLDAQPAIFGPSGYAVELDAFGTAPRLTDYHWDREPNYYLLKEA
jgi:hypothetical protein